MKKYSIIVAGGRGTRMGSEVPKQFLLMKGLPILMHTINKFHQAEDNIQIIITLPKDQIPTWKSLVEEYSFSTPHQVVTGGNTRFQSVDNALQYIPNQDCLIAIHDGVRPLVDTSVIQKSFTEAASFGTAIPTVALKESIRWVGENENRTEDRSEYRMVQTPQTFRSDVIFPAFENDYRDIFTDDASVAEFSGHSVHLFEGNYENIKITTPEDLKLGEALLN
ncbi:MULTISPECIES: 2-C-methyl-D-erythritol 4-phosphate cytidylyltransferase [Flammeovirga]|uniref:2-C-methyl-D-erythritol 4-phosphate cytidylyltransferase n=1 Tax=Flammeovirga agarivorans TaxID=2726742 RepID=A0A7X8SMB8_9BACT|nr:MULTISPECIES: 2-C-methyl-D-erythritol 4-phosphate cytidylyltransferase [Flammeovirga]NLR92871.1 2-C-methyl-D-erythritol 4-phosphate cytidylyltransferase [Flammeovirga agarivorans]